MVGESGCGKSTLGRTLIRLIPATDGHVYLDGEDISGLKGKALKQMRKKAQIIFRIRPHVLIQDVQCARSLWNRSRSTI